MTDDSAAVDYDVPVTRPVDIRKYLYLLADAPPAEPELPEVRHPGAAGNPPLCNCPDARSWRKHMSAEWVAFREQQAEREHALRIRQASWDISGHLYPRRSPDGEAARVGAVLGSIEEWA